MGQAFDRDGNVLGEAYGETKREVFDKLNAEFRNAHEIRIRAAEQLIRLTDAMEDAIKKWAADDRLWTTQETVETNLRTFARVILRESTKD